MPRRKGFPQISSMPAIRMQSPESSRNVPSRSQEVSNLKELPLSTSDLSQNSTTDFTMNAAHWLPISISSGSEDETDKSHKTETDIKDFHQLPVVLQKEPSMLNLRSRHDPKYQGVRAKKTARIVNKVGVRNIDTINIPERSARFFRDIVHTLIDAQWRWVLTVFIFSYFGSWLFFATLFYIIGWAHGDLIFDPETGQRLGEGKEECVRGATNFAGFFLLSVESQVSTGYGEKYPTEECPEAIFLLIVQLTVGLVIDAAMVGIVYVKMIRPPKYAEFKFSRKAVICQRDGKLCLIFRAADFKQDHSIDSKIRAYLFEDKITAEGERTGKNQQRLKLENNGRVFLIWPQTVCHYIDETSPFYDMSARDLIQKHFEIVVSLTGISRYTGQTTQARTSYLSKEVLWGHRFSNIITYDREHGHYVTDVDSLDTLERIDTALCSAQRLEEIVNEALEALEKKSVFHWAHNFINDIEEFDEDDDEGLQMMPISSKTVVSPSPHPSM
ncbi:CLUMA_CG013151, isoform A, partial [Clunio marinus]